MTQGGLGERRKDSDSEIVTGVDIRGLWNEAPEKNPCYEPLRLCIRRKLEWNEVEIAGGMFGAEALGQCVSLWGSSSQGFPRPPKDLSSVACVRISFSSINKVCGTNPPRGRGDMHRTGPIPQGAHTPATYAARAIPTTSSSEFYLAPRARNSSGEKKNQIGYRV